MQSASYNLLTYPLCFIQNPASKHAHMMIHKGDYLLEFYTQHKLKLHEKIISDIRSMVNHSKP